MSVRRKTFTVDGRPTDYYTLADELGITVRALTMQVWKRPELSMQEIVDMYRDGRIQTRVHGAHCVHGRWLTIAEAAEELGLAPGTLSVYYYRWNVKTLEETVDRYLWLRQCPQSTGPKPRRFRVHGKLLTVKEAAEKTGTSAEALYCRMRRGQTLEQAVDRIERRKRKIAEEKILSILMGGK